MKVPSPEDRFTPLTPKTLEDTQLDFGFLADLALKTVYADANCTTARAAEKMCLPETIVETLLQHLYQEKLVEIRGQISIQNHRYAILERGWQRANRLLEINGYIGPAPVSLSSYNELIALQNMNRKPASPELVMNALSELVLPENIMHTVGLAVNARRSLFMYGESGNGKTSIATLVHSAQPGEIWIPYAIEIDGQIIKTYDQHNHYQVDVGMNGFDKRWIKIKRPLIIVGGEMTIQTMDLVYSRHVGYYEAPFQLKANGGTLVIDDFGRQRVDPGDLLNRWIIPLEQGRDFLTLHTGKKIEVNFSPMLIFATNLDLDGLVDDAFLRRMGYRLYIGPPTRQQYSSIFQKMVMANGFIYDAELLQFLFTRYDQEKRIPKCSEPRDLIHRVMDICRYFEQSPVLSEEMLDLAWINYFGNSRPRQA
jgi:predicted ATPase with chaperone activity